MWFLRSAPLNPRDILQAKLRSTLLPVLCVAETMSLVSSGLLDVTWQLTLMGGVAAALAALGSLGILVEAASLAFLFTFAVVCGLAFRERRGARLVTGFGMTAAAGASLALVVRLRRSDPAALAFFLVLVLAAVLGRRFLPGRGR